MAKPNPTFLDLNYHHNEINFSPWFWRTTLFKSITLGYNFFFSFFLSARCVANYTICLCDFWWICRRQTQSQVNGTFQWLFTGIVWRVHFSTELHWKYKTLLEFLDLAVACLLTLSPPTHQIWRLNSLTIILNPISIHRQVNDLVDLLQQDIRCNIILYALHYLFL